jgi:myosin heavy subunit
MPPNYSLTHSLSHSLTVVLFGLFFRVNSEDEDLDHVKLRNAIDEIDGTDNLINLPHLHEPAILFCLQRRYDESDIYTYTGPILIAVNPFKRVQLYTPQILELYYNQGLLKAQGIEGGGALPPHVYAIADASYRAMMYASSNAPRNPKSTAEMDQVILISGESGAGKIRLQLHSTSFKN